MARYDATSRRGATENQVLEYVADDLGGNLDEHHASVNDHALVARRHRRQSVGEVVGQPLLRDARGQQLSPLQVLRNSGR
jgi:hypothetical protein